MYSELPTSGLPTHVCNPEVGKREGNLINSRFIRGLKPVPYGYAQFVSNSTQIKTNWIYFCKNHNTNDKPSKGWCRWKLLLWLFQRSLPSVWEPQNDLLESAALRVLVCAAPYCVLFVRLDNTEERQQPILVHCIWILDTAHYALLSIWIHDNVHVMGIFTHCALLYLITC